MALIIIGRFVGYFYGILPRKFERKVSKFATTSDVSNSIRSPFGPNARQGKAKMPTVIRVSCDVRVTLSVTHAYFDYRGVL